MFHAKVLEMELNDSFSNFRSLLFFGDTSETGEHQKTRTHTHLYQQNAAPGLLWWLQRLCPSFEVFLCLENTKFPEFCTYIPLSCKTKRPKELLNLKLEATLCALKLTRSSCFAKFSDFQTSFGTVFCILTPWKHKISECCMHITDPDDYLKNVEDDVISWFQTNR